MAQARSLEHTTPVSSSISFALAWLTGPVYLAAIEYLWRIADALGRRNSA